MTWFDDLIEQAMPYLTTEEIAGTAGSSWAWSYYFDDTDADLGASYTATAVIKADVADASSVATVACTFPAAGQVRCTVTPSASTDVQPGQYLHEVELQRTSDGRRVKVVGGGGGIFYVAPGVNLPHLVGAGAGGAASNVAADTDGAAYFTVGASGYAVLTDTDGTPYFADSGTSVLVAADTDGVPYVP